jgi:hypothetical protein
MRGEKRKRLAEEMKTFTGDRYEKTVFRKPDRDESSEKIQGGGCPDGMGTEKWNSHSQYP